MSAPFTPTDEQRRILDHADGHLLIEAAAGSGKTSVLALLALEYAAVGRAVLALTFSANGKAVLADRLAAWNPRLADKVTVATIDEVCEAEAQRCLADDRLSVDDGWALDHVLPCVIERTNEAFAGDERHPQLEGHAEARRDLLDAFRFIKQSLAPGLIGDEQDPDWIEQAIGDRPYPVWHAFLEYERRRAVLPVERRKRRGRGFRLAGDACYDLVRAAGQEGLNPPGFGQRYLLLDEFHDTSPLQLEFLSLWGRRLQRVVAVGDRDQALQAWRAADAAHIFPAFCERFAVRTRLPLSLSFRFGPRLAQLANALRSPSQAPVQGAGDSPGRVVEERRPLAAFLKALGQDPDAGGCAILARDAGQLVPVQLALAELGQPFRLHERVLPFWRRGEARLLQALAEIVAAPRTGETRAHAQPDPEYLKRQRRLLAERLLSLPGWLLGDATRQDLIDHIADSAANWRAVCEMLPRVPFSPDAGEAQRGRRSQLQAAIAALLEAPADQALGPLVRAFARAARLETDLAAYAGSREQGRARVAAWRHLVDHLDAQGFTAAGWLKRLADLERRHRYPSETARPGPLLSSIFHAKGSEWDRVVLVGLEEGRFPLANVPFAEEKRYAYVACTRARRALILHAEPGATPGRLLPLLMEAAQ
ncbi:UvrD-helicase domain-containing protein [Crenobacter cavernae]|uniref:DNA 3'-5' helicase n=1 Tax=Crenobacter cavernae TaxID=2290923 RepID=A0ABY0FH49_9NEIS|nr:ATP-dependent helicase [Crenobacter cavernae]RXZ44773.1 ATP-dependent helicase [Crenobacter cavernae]